MSVDHVFVDTNILVYGHDIDAGVKHGLAREKISCLWQRDVLPSISVQVLQELYVNLIRKEVAASVAREVVSDYLEWDVIDNDRFLLIEGIRCADAWKLSFWDALILAAAKRAKAKEVWTEDLNPGQVYEGIRIVNPLAEPKG